MKEKKDNKPPIINESANTSVKSKKPFLTKAVAKNESRLKVYVLPMTVLIAIVISWYYNHLLASRVNTPLDKPKVIDESVYKSAQNLDRFWGTYRSNLYFGLKTRSSNPFSVGMMWFNQYSSNLEIRHWCDQNDGLKKYGWTAHDGRNFGVHDISEKGNAFQIRNSWVKRHGGSDGGDWTVRTQVTQTDTSMPSLISIMFYFSAEYSGWIKSAKKQSRSSILEGETADLGKFKIKIELNNKAKPMFFDYTSGNSTVSHIKENLLQNRHFARIESDSKEVPEYVGLREVSDLDESNFLAYQVTGRAPFEFEIMFESQSLRDELKSQSLPMPKELKGSEFDTVLSEWHKKFEQKFQTLFKFEDKNFSSSAVKVAQATLSNLLGGIGFFSGQSIVQSLNNKEPVLYWNANLYTAVPSRSFFPRGFLWDEGFHNILISKWDLEITKDIIGHWLDLMNVEGWIPREVILGEEARAKVPKEFWVQNSNYANPPTLFLPLDQLIKQVNEVIAKSETHTVSNAEYAYLNHIYDRLTHWYDWFNKTQVGKLPFTYRWRGRVIDSLSELNPKTLTSGLDDYPRASHPTDQERHLDLRCWIALASKVMGNLYEIIKKDDKTSTNMYKEHFITLKNNKLLDELHWSNKQYADYGLHSDQIRLVRQRPTREQMHVNPNSLPMVRDVQVEPSYQYVNSIGYVSLFPMLLELLDADSPKLGLVLDQLRDSKELWTPFGLRSLSKSAPLYDKRNTEHDPPYWRSSIWINVNYLALKSLKHYSSVDGPHREKAEKIYGELRTNLINNIVKNYERTGYIWENYNDKTGNGQGSHPFTGWSSLVVLIMAEVY